MFFNPACGFCRELVPKLADLCGLRRQPRKLSGDAALGVGGEGADPRQSAVVAGALQNGSVSLPLVLIISTGNAEANRQLFDEHKVTVTVLLQKEMEVADAYKAMGTPSGYLVNAEGKITNRLAMGGDALLKLLDGNPEAATQKAEMDKGHLSPALSSNGEKGEEARGNRFSSRSLARSKIKRDGLKAGTPVPDFRLPRLDGRGELA